MTTRQWISMLLAIVVGVGVGFVIHRARQTPPPPDPDAEAHALTRQALFAEIQPVKLSNCTLERLGEKNDGGYLVCTNLLEGVQAGYSYGINGYDGWGCDISKRANVRLHQYDCFETAVPVCPGGQTQFHPECIGPTKLDVGRPFDTLDNQIVKNGDAGKRIIMKIDVEGAEWDTFLTADPAVLERIDQLVVEFHFTNEMRFVAAVRRLKQFFYIAHLHYNNWSCSPEVAPFPAFAYEALLVNKRLGVVDPSGSAAGLHPLDAKNHPERPDCQAAAGR